MHRRVLPLWMQRSETRRSRRRAAGVRRDRGIALVVGLVTLVGLLGFAGTGLTRSMGDLNISGRFVSREQAFHLAEAGVDEVIAELAAGGTDGVKASFSDAEGWQDASSDADCEAGMTCRRRTFAMTAGTVDVTVLDADGQEPAVRSLGAAGSASRTVTIVLSRQASFPAILGAATIIEDVSETFELHANNPNWLISGHDHCGSEPSLPAITTSTDYVRDTAAFPETLLVPEKVIGAPGDYSGSWPEEQRSVHSAEGEPNLMTAEEVEEFVSQACSNADYAYLDGGPDDLDATSGTLELKITGSQLGTHDNPVTVCMDADPVNEQKVKLRGLTGAGVLIVNSNFDVSSLDWAGLVIVHGANAELDLRGTVRIRGAAIVAATGGSPLETEFEMGDPDNLDLSRELLYCSEALSIAAEPFGGLTAGGVRTKYWHAD